MSNRIPEAYDPVVQLLEDAADGAHAHGAAIGLKQNTETVIRADLVALVGTPAGPGGNPPAVPDLKALWNNAKAAKTAATVALRTACSNGRALATVAVNILKPRLGNQWNSAWQAAGFPGASLAIPANPLPLLQQLRAYFAQNPAQAAPQLQPIAVTAAACGAAVQAISDASEASNQSNTDAGAAQKNYEAGMDAARARLSGLRAELEQLLADSDPRWLAFGFDMPGHPDTPEVPANLTLTPGAPGSRMVFANWDDARRADSYRVTVSGPGGAKITETIVTESEATLQNLPAVATVSVAVARARRTRRLAPRCRRSDVGSRTPLSRQRGRGF
jgi:hypothetical protein